MIMSAMIETETLVCICNIALARGTWELNKTLQMIDYIKSWASKLACGLPTRGKYSFESYSSDWWRKSAVGQRRISGCHEVLMCDVDLFYLFLSQCDNSLSRGWIMMKLSLYFKSVGNFRLDTNIWKIYFRSIRGCETCNKVDVMFILCYHQEWK